MQTIDQDKAKELIRDLELILSTARVDIDFGAFGVISRMNTNFNILKEHYSAKRKRTINARIRETLRQIAADAVVAQALL